MADPLAPARNGRGRLLAAAIVVAGLALAVTGVLPWAGMTAEVGLIHAEVTAAVHGTDETAGWAVVASGVAAAGLGLLGIRRSRVFAGLAILPGAIAAFALAMFLTNPRGLTDRLSLTVPGVLDIRPTIMYGWFAALAASILVASFAASALLRRGGPDQS